MRNRDIIWIEQRAVAIAAMVACGEGGGKWHGSELAGWMRYGDNRERREDWTPAQERHWHAGWLAAHIWAENGYPLTLPA